MGQGRLRRAAGDKLPRGRGEAEKGAWGTWRYTVAGSKLTQDRGEGDNPNICKGAQGAVQRHYAARNARGRARPNENMGKDTEGSPR
eukprot:6396153-Pyramimonas_sp.AAC.1